MEGLKLAEIDELLREDYYLNQIDDKKSFEESLNELFDKKKENHAVLGLDVYKYSKYKSYQQDIIPFILKKIYKRTYDDYFSNEKYTKNIYASLEKDFLNTGDGGYWIFDNPLDAIVFSFYLNANIHLFNSFIIYPNLRKLIGPITIRFAVTYDKIFQFENNFYGSAIINNARIMSKDKLNRMLIDNNSYEWFLKNINGIENMQDFMNVYIVRKSRKITPNSLLPDEFFEKYKTSFFLNQKQRGENPSIMSIISQKLERINVKNDEFDIYNIFIQYQAILTNDDEVVTNDDPHFYKELLNLSLGNLNTNGI